MDELETQIAAHQATADAIAAKGKDKDGALTELAKGAHAAIIGLVDLLKGRLKPPPKDELADDDEPAGGGGEGGGAGGAGGGEGGGEGDAEAEAAAAAKKKADEDGEGGGGPGFQDMRMGRDGTEEFVDATEYITHLEKKIDAQGKDLGKLRKAVERGNATNAVIAERLEAFISVYAQNTVPLHKAMARVQESILDLPAATHTPGADGARLAARHALNAAAEKVAADTGIDKTKLVKAMSKHIIDEDQLRGFKHLGRFSDDETENADLVKRVAAL